MEKLKISVLFVDDEKIIRTVYSKVFSEWVDQVYLAENGQQGLEIFRQRQPDLVITDIKMPLMSGLDMSVMIRKVNPNARIVILSAFSEASYLIRAIEIGIKNFLIKPVDNQQILQAIVEQAREIAYENKLIEEEQKRIKAELELKHNEQILQAVSETAEHLLKHGFNKKSFDFSLACLGHATKVSRVYFFENFRQDDQNFSRQTHEWVSVGIEPQIDNTGLMYVPHDDPSFSRWAQMLRSGRTINGLIKHFPEAEREILEPQNIVSLVAIPVFVQNEWFGFIGFDDCVTERIWSASEINSLTTAANLLGAAIHRTSIENELQHLNAELEDRVEQRTLNLQLEIAERESVEIMLRQSEEKYRTIFENANDAIFLTIDAKIQLINPRFYELTGYYPRQLKGKSFIDLVHPAHREFVNENYQRRINGESYIQSYDIQIITAKGENLWVEIKSNPILWEGRNGLLSFLTDIQARKSFESELRELNINLEARVNEELKHRERQQELFLHKSKLESLGELSAGMAHEINQPLGSLSMSLDNILDEMYAEKLEPNYLAGKIELMFSDIDRIRKIIDHVRVFSRDQQNEDQQVFDIAETVNNSLLMVNRLFINNQIDLKVSLKNGPFLTFGNPNRLEQVILNVLSNARHAVEKRQHDAIPGYVKIILLETSTDKNTHKIRIEDNGIGIPEHILGNVFDPFFTTKNAQEGTGLGLSISYGIIRDMKGSIEIESQQNHKTTVIIKLPAYQ